MVVSLRADDPVRSAPLVPQTSRKRLLERWDSEVSECLVTPLSIGLCALRNELRPLTRALTVEERELAREIEKLTRTLAPQLLDQPGVGPLAAAQVLLSWSHRRRIRSEAAFAPRGLRTDPPSSGQTIRYRLDRSGDRQLNRALHMILVTRRRTISVSRSAVDSRNRRAAMSGS
jgi:transposase